MTSIRKRLFAILVAATTLVWLCAAAWIYVDTGRRLQHVLDTRLMEAARMVASLVSSGDISHRDKGEAAAPALVDTVDATGDGRSEGYERQLSCQIWSFDGHLIGRSSGAPDLALSDGAGGFSERVVNGELWRVYAVVEPDKGIRVLVGDRLGLRDQLVTNLVRSLALPALLMIPLLALLIWTTVGGGLRPLRRLARALRDRAPDDLTPIDAGRAPVEIGPVIQALNGLFGKVAEVREREQAFTGFAAHELRTPLAGLRAQAQVAIHAGEGPTRERAMRQILTGVDRTSRLVQQLLALARLDATQVDARPEAIDAGAVLVEIVAAVRLPGRTVHVDPGLHGHAVMMNRELFTLAVRNLHENAMQHARDGGDVSWRLEEQDGVSRIIVEDDGPGIAASELRLVTRRFYRGGAQSAPGSGLGLSIVEAALAQAGWRLELGSRHDGGGLVAAITNGGQGFSAQDPLV